MTELLEKIVEAWEDTPDWANLSRAQIAVNMVLEEAAKAFDSNGDWPQMIPQDEAAAAIRALKGRDDD